ncbi:hypothetical protein [Amycolatopsis sp. H20-H5]|nr:hypothetical protein [Amycolatopsis sp. H20-H5]MEC3977454.1 hypothetical protein [Amycolatopsis sp. H20-H5]
MLAATSAVIAVSAAALAQQGKLYRYECLPVGAAPVGTPPNDYQPVYWSY